MKLSLLERLDDFWEDNCPRSSPPICPDDAEETDFWEENPTCGGAGVVRWDWLPDVDGASEFT